MGIYLSTLCLVVQEQNKQGIAAYNFKWYSFRILFLGVVHFRGSPFGYPFGESMDWSQCLVNHHVMLNFTLKSGTSYQHTAWISDVNRDILNSCNSFPVRDFYFRGNRQLFSEKKNRRTFTRLLKWLKETKGT